MKLRLRAAACMMLMLSGVFTLSSCTYGPGKEYDLLFGVSSTGGQAYQWGTAFCDVINDHSDILYASAITTLGSSEDVNLLAANEIDAGICTRLVAASAARGEVDWEGRPVEGLRILNYMYADYFYICVSENSPYNSLSDLEGRRVNVGDKGGGIYTGAVQVLQALGIEESEYFNSYYLSVTEAASAVQDGSLDALFIYGSASNSSIMEMQASRSGLKIIGLTPEEIDTICENNPMFAPAVMEDSYPGIPQIETVGGAMCFLGTDRLPDEVVYELCRILDEYHDELVTITEYAADSTMENTALMENDIVPLADGTRAYLEDAGID